MLAMIAAFLLQVSQPAGVTPAAATVQAAVPSPAASAAPQQAPKAAGSTPAPTVPALKPVELWQIRLAYLVGLAFLLIYLALASLLTRKRAGFLTAAIGEDGRYSTSKFQFLVWTGVVVFAYAALFAIYELRSITPGVPGWSLPPNVLLAMGFSVITMATAKGVTSSYVYSGRSPKLPAMRPARLADLVAADDSGIPDLSKVQMLIWTFIAIAVYVFQVNAAMGSGTDLGKFPDIDQTLMILMGIGQGAYLGTKIASGGGGATIAKLNPEFGPIGTSVAISGSGFGSQGVVLFGSATVVPASYRDTSVVFTVPATGNDGQVPTAGQQIYIAVLSADPANPNSVHASSTSVFTVTA